MKIGSSTDPFKTTSGPRLVARESPAASEPSPIAGQPPASLSELSRKLTAMESHLGDGAVDVSRVSAIKSAIRNGEFRVNADVVADRLLQSVQDLLAETK